MAPDSIGTWWREDTKRQRDNLTTQLYEVKKLIWMSCSLPPPTHTHTHTHTHTQTRTHTCTLYQSLKRNALEIYLKPFKCNRADLKMSGKLSLQVQI